MREIKLTKYQTVIITLSDGRIGTFVGKVIVNPDEVNSMDGFVTSVEFTYPQELPEGYSLEELEVK